MNLEYFKRKFDTLYKQNDTKREDIAAKTGIDKNKITKLRRMKYDTQPTIDDLIAISDYYHVTVDELLRPQEETEQNKEQEKSFDSLGDIAKSLFEIGKCIKLHLASINVEVGQTEYGEPITDYHTCIYFSNQRMCELLNEWKKISFATFDVGCGEKLKSLWEKDAIENYKQYTKENDFCRSDFEQGEILARNLLNYYRAFEADQASPRYPLTDRERNLIESQLGYFSLFEEDEKDDIRTALDILGTSPSAFSIVPLPDLDNE